MTSRCATARPARSAPATGLDPRRAQDRVRIAQAAARLIAEHGIADWSLAKRKAARAAACCPSATPLPGDDEIEAALVDYHALVRRRRARGISCAHSAEALAAGCDGSRRSTPLLVGGVAAGWATEHSDIRLELVADDAKTVEIALLNARRRVCRPMPTRRSAGPHELVHRHASREARACRVRSAGRRSSATPRSPRARGAASRRAAVERCAREQVLKRLAAIAPRRARSRSGSRRRRRA